MITDTIDWEHTFPAVKIPFTSGCELEIEAVMDKTLKPRPQLPGAGLAPAA